MPNSNLTKTLLQLQYIEHYMGKKICCHHDREDNVSYFLKMHSHPYCAQLEKQKNQEASCNARCENSNSK